MQPNTRFGATFEFVCCALKRWDTPTLKGSCSQSAPFCATSNFVPRLEVLGSPDLWQRMDHLSTMGAAPANDCKLPTVSDDAPDVVTSRTRPARGLGPGGWPLGGVSTPSAWGGAGGAPGGPWPHAVSKPRAMIEYESEDDDEESLAGNLSHFSLASGGKQRKHTDHTCKSIGTKEHTITRR